jgi:hypothetical protein
MPGNPILNYLDTLPPVSVSPFVLRRHEDVTGVSGTGIVADGALFPAAGGSKAVVRWRGERGSTVVWDNLRHVQEIHGHDGRTLVELLPVGELIAALKAVAAIPDATSNPAGDDPTYLSAVEGYNDALRDVRQAISDAVEALHDHDDEEEAS